MMRTATGTVVFVDELSAFVRLDGDNRVAWLLSLPRFPLRVGMRIGVKLRRQYGPELLARSCWPI